MSKRSSIDIVAGLQAPPPTNDNDKKRNNSLSAGRAPPSKASPDNKTKSKKHDNPQESFSSENGIDLSSVDIDQEGFLTKRKVEKDDEDQSWNQLESEFNQDENSDSDDDDKNDKDDDDDDDDDDDNKDSMESLAQIFQALFIKYKSSIILSLIALLVAAILYLTDQSDTMLWGVSSTTWAFFIPVIVLTYILSVCIEAIVFYGLSLLLHRASWKTRMLIFCFTGVFHYILFFGVLYFWLIDFWLTLDYDQPGEPKALEYMAFLDIICHCGIFLCFGIVIRRVLVKLLVDAISRKTFRKDVIEIVLMEDTVKALCTEDIEKRADIHARRKATLDGERFHKLIKRIKRSKISLPLVFDRSSKTWNYSQQYVVEVGTHTEMTIISKAIFDALNCNEDETLSFAEWTNYFQAFAMAKHAYELFFDDDAAKSKQVTKAQFTIAMIAFINRRKRVSAAHRGLMNLENTISSLVGVVFWFLMVFIVSDMLGYDSNHLLVSFITFAIGFSFAFGSTIRIFIESAMFVFGSRVYEVGDIVCFDGETLRVSTIELYSTHFIEPSSNQYFFAPNHIIAKKTLTNLGRSGTAVIVLTFRVDWAISVETIEKIRSKTLKWIQEHSAMWRPQIDVYLSDPTECCDAQLLMCAYNRLQWQELGAIGAAKTHLIDAISRICQELNISPTANTLPVSLLKPR